MKHSNALLDNLTRSSSRLSKGIMVLLGVAVLLVSTTYWSFQRLIEEHHDTVRFHFTRLMQNIQEQELFLTSLRQRSLRGELMPRDAAQMPGVEPRQWEGDGMYRGQENPSRCRSVSGSPLMPRTLTRPPRLPSSQRT